jgi:hypothetical protein
MSHDATECVSSELSNNDCSMAPINHKPPKILTRGSKHAINLQILRLIKLINVKFLNVLLGVVVSR